MSPLITDQVEQLTGNDQVIASLHLIITLLVIIVIILGVNMLVKMLKSK